MTTRKLYSEELVQLSESLEEMGNLVEACLLYTSPSPRDS